MKETALVALGSALGGTARFWLVQWAAPLSRQFPASTVAINIAGSFAIGLFAALTVASGRYPAPEPARLFVMVGLCGGFTTFSSFSLQTLDLLRGGAPGRALVNIGVSVMLCLGAVAAGHAIATRLNGGPVQLSQAERGEQDF